MWSFSWVRPGSLPGLSADRGRADRVECLDHPRVRGRVRSPRERFGESQGVLDDELAARPLRITLRQLREVYDPPGAARGERDDCPKRQLLEVLDCEIW